MGREFRNYDEARRLRLATKHSDESQHQADELDAITTAAIICALSGFIVAFLAFTSMLSWALGLTLWLALSAFLLVWATAAKARQAKKLEQKRLDDVKTHGMAAGDARFWGRGEK
ncbi:MAG: hypothetical protein NXH91_10620 [Phyllobacteriaceae bacterium]|nr:hypothetical protein [Phyllobacteriaceae bacterium]